MLAAFVNAQLLLLVCAWLLFEAARRFRNPVEIRLGVMIPVALLGLAANLVSLAILAPDRRSSLNVRAAYLEVLMDSAGSLGVLAAGIGIARYGWRWLDPLVSGLIAPGGQTMAKRADATNRELSRQASGRCNCCRWSPVGCRNITTVLTPGAFVMVRMRFCLVCAA